MLDPRILGLGFIATALLSGYTGWKLRDADYQAHLKRDAQLAVKQEKAVRKVEGVHEAISQANREQLAVKQQQVQVVYRTVIKEVPRYVTETKFEKQVVAGGGLPAGFVWSYNRAAANSTLPIPPGLNPDAPTGLGMSALAGATATNFALCHTWRGELQQWHEWYNQHSAEWNKSQGEHP